MRDNKCSECVHYEKCMEIFEKAKSNGEYESTTKEEYFSSSSDSNFFYKRISFDKSEFTDDELLLLKMAFKLIEDVAEIERTSNSDVNRINAIFNLKEKLGIYEVLEE